MVARICIAATGTGAWEVGMGSSWHSMVTVSRSSALELDRDVTWGAVDTLRCVKVEEYDSSHHCTLGKQWVTIGSHHPGYPRDYILNNFYCIIKGGLTSAPSDSGSAANLLP